MKLHEIFAPFCRAEPLPSLDEKGLAFFKQVLNKATCYLEYGSGGSTLYANNIATLKTIISVDSDKRWIQRVRTALTRTETQVFLEYCDIGSVGAWGRPRSTSKVGEYWRYMTAPWRVAQTQELNPDLILVDGRFRIASFLYSIVCAAPETIILFDDYVDRSYYKVVEEFCPLQHEHGRMGVFRASHDFSVPDISARIAQYSIDPR